MTPPDDLHEWISFEDPDEHRTWVFDLTFLLSRWTCIYGRGCQGVLTEAAPELGRGCCSYGAHFTGDEDRARAEAAAASLTPAEWQHAGPARRKGISVRRRDGTWRTRIHEGACILLNHPGFPGGAGCALHLAALQRGQAPLELKPEVCWQLPLRQVDSVDELGHVTSTVREWKRRDWSNGGQEFHWWCTDAPDAFVGERSVLASMADELVAMVGQRVYDRLVAAVAERCASTTVLPHPALRRRPS
ncbi:MAG: hypothetical protein ACRDZ9_02250 [Acidimicrobiales bacterium]